jgi:soluble lytic murein transglycosylase-like protein
MPDVRTALTTAASTHVWTVSRVNLPPELIYAIGWQESGWQSAIRACDGGIGTMQVMPDTAKQMNQRFDAHWDVTTLDGNTMIGSAYVQWLIKYLGDSYFNGDYSVDASACISDDPTVPDYKTPCLLNAVIAAYNFGAGAVGQDTIVIPNPGYVSDVRALMTSCPCLTQ